jgi:hypothetical protein
MQKLEKTWLKKARGALRLARHPFLPWENAEEMVGGF